MFWNKKEVVEAYGLPITLSKRQAFNRFTGSITSHFLAYKSGNEWRGLVGYEQFKEEMDETRKIQELILDHLKLKYVPETETKQPAKLVEKKVDLGIDFGHFKPFPRLMDEFSGYPVYVSDYVTGKPTIKPKKRGRPKKK